MCVCVADKLLAPPPADSDGESDGSDRVPVPSFQNSFSQAIEKALLQLDSEAASVPPPVVEPGLTPDLCVLSNLRTDVCFQFQQQLKPLMKLELFSCKLVDYFLHSLFQMKREGRRRRRSRRFSSALRWFTQSR